MSDPQSLSQRVTLTNKKGLHARASHKFVDMALKYDAQIEVRSHNSVCAETVIADSVMELLLLGSSYGQDITITASGPDAKTALEALVALVKSRFGEEE